MEIKSDKHDGSAYDFETIKSSLAFDKARRNGEVVVLPKENELQLDIDSDEDLAYFHKARIKFDMHISGIDEWKIRDSRNGNKHITVTLHNDIGPKQRIMYQLMLGSDRTREMLSYIRYRNEDPHPTLFIEKTPLQLTRGSDPEEAE